MEHEDYPDPTPPSEPHPDEINETEAKQIPQKAMTSIKAENTSDTHHSIARPRNIKAQDDIREAIGTAADKSEEIFEMLNERQTGEDSELEQSLNRIATMLETFDLRLERIEAKLGIQDDD